MVKKAGKQAPIRTKKRQRARDDDSVSDEAYSQAKKSAVLDQAALLELDRQRNSQSSSPVGESARASVSLSTLSSLTTQASLEAAAKARAEADAKRDSWLEEHASEIYATDMRREFMGWVELEGDPGHLTIMLERLGIERAKVVEVESIEEMLSEHHCLKYGIIFLSQYHEDGQDYPEEEQPDGLWFANQTVDNACATIAILNIINNVLTLDIGENLKSFRDFTKSFSPAMKGEALANFHFCRSIHNAMARRTEMLVANLALEQQATPKASKSKSARKAKRKRNERTSISDIANHYVAYIPFAGNLWQLDGMNKHPRNMGPLVNGEAWINTVRDDIKRRWDTIGYGALAGSSILAIIEDKVPALVDMLGCNINELNWIEHCLNEKRDYWNKSVATHSEDNDWGFIGEPIRGPDDRFKLTQSILDRKGIRLTVEQKDDISTRAEEYLTDIRFDIVCEQTKFREMIKEQRIPRDEQWEKYKDGMFDYGPVIHQWLKFLHQNDVLNRLIDDNLEKDGTTFTK